MKPRLVLLLLAAHGGAALAQYKCTAADGAVTFQQTPCFGAGTEQKLVVVPNGHPPAASGAAPVPRRAPVAPPPAASQSVDKRMLANYRIQDNRDKLVEVLKLAQDEADARRRQHDDDVAAARRQYDSPADAQLLADTLVSLDGRYRALSVLDDRRIADARNAIDSWDRTEAAATRGQ